MDDPATEIRTLPALRTNLPTVLTSFIGRQRETAEISARLRQSRLITLTGPGGCGKTRLALAVATAASSQYSDGAGWVELAQLSDPALVPQAVARVLGVGEDAGRRTTEALQSFLRDKQLLLVLDNCEHLASACAALAEALLSGPGLVILATSREPLRVVGEALYPVTPLSLPPAGARSADIEPFDAIQLFVERARSKLPGFALTAENADAVVSVCRRLDGLPLAIELASVRVNVIAVEQIAARLDNRLTWLASAERTPEAHHRTLRAAMDWSYELLSPAEQCVLRRLAVFAGGWSLDGAEAVCAGGEVERAQVFDTLAALIDKSLVVAETLQRGEARYHLLETIRQYAQEKLAGAGERPATRDRHLQHYRQVGEETRPKLRGPYQQLWLSWLEGEHDNLRAALAWSLESRQVEAGMLLANAVGGFWEMRGHVTEGAAWYERLLAQPRDSLPLPALVKGLAFATFLAMFLGDAETAMAHGREAMALCEAAGHRGRPLLMWALAALASGSGAAGDHETVYALGERAISLARELDEAEYLGMGLLAHGGSAMAVGRYEQARAEIDESLSLFRTQGDTFRIAMALNLQGDLARCESDDARAQAAYEESVALLREIEARRDLASVLHNLAHACLHRGQSERAAALLRESLAAHQAQQNARGVGECLTGFAAVALARGLPAAGARLLAAAVSVGGPSIVSHWPAERMEYEHITALARAALGEAEFETEQAQGRRLSMQAAITYALSLPLEWPPAEAEPDGLTQREREVAALIGQGKSNAEIAAQLVVTKRTVEKHISNILSKLSLAGRVQIVRWAIARGLAGPAE